MYRRPSHIITVCLLFVLTSCTIPYTPIVPAESQELTYRDVFLRDFPVFRRAILNMLNISDFWLYDEPYYASIEASYYKECWLLVYLAWLDIKAYEITGNITYLMEAKWIVDNLDARSDRVYNGVLMVEYPDDYNNPTKDHAGFTTAFYVLVKQKLNEHGMGNYPIKEYVDFILSKAVVNNETDLAWGCMWFNTASDPKAGVNRITPFIFMMCYLHSKGVGNYSSEISRAIHWVDRAYLEDYKAWGYNIGDTSPNHHYTHVKLFFYLAGYKYYPSPFNMTRLNQTLLNYDELTYTAPPALVLYVAVQLLANALGFQLNSFGKTQIYNYVYKGLPFNATILQNDLVTRTRSALLQVVYLLIALAEFPDATFPVAERRVSSPDNKGWYTTDTGYLVAISVGYGSFFVRRPWRFAYFEYPSATKFHSATFDEDEYKWIITSTYGNLMANYTIKVHDLQVIELCFSVNGSHGEDHLVSILDLTYSVFLVTANLTEYTIWNYTAGSGLGNFTGVFSNKFLVFGTRYALFVEADNSTFKTVVSTQYKFANIHTTYRYAKAYAITFFDAVDTNFNDLKNKLIQTFSYWVSTGNFTISYFAFSDKFKGNWTRQFRRHDSIVLYTVNQTVIESSSLADRVLSIELSAPSGTDSKTVVYTADYGKPTRIIRTDINTTLKEVSSLSELESTTDCWFYNSTSKLLYIKVRHGSVVPIEVSWQPLEEEEAPPPPPPEEEKPTIPIKWVLFGILLLIVIMVIAYITKISARALLTLGHSGRYVRFRGKFST